MYTVELLTEAEIELYEACKWYEDQQPELGKRFLAEVDKYLISVGNNPLHYPVRFSQTYRFATLRIFPYLIVFRVESEKNRVYVISIFHTSRDPKTF